MRARAGQTSEKTPIQFGRRGLRAALAGRRALERADQLLAPIAPTDRPGLIVFVFHCVFADEAEVDSGLIDPHERATPEGLSRLFAYFRDHGYRFVSAGEIDRGLPPGGHYAHLTFDDGFANNLRLLELLAREGVHATVSVSVNHVRYGTAFWWNVVYRERHRRGQQAIVAPEYARLRRMKADEVNRHLSSEFGPQALKAIGDVDRPLTGGELRQMAASPWIEIGNHTLDHAVLPAYPLAEAEAQISGAQDWLRETVGEAPFFIAYPNGDADAGLAEMARRQGLRVGATLVSARNDLPASDSARLRLGRFRIVLDRRERAKMRAVRSSLQLAAATRRLVVGRRWGDPPSAVEEPT
ncbi:MAG: polysaccharide deacetylase family protein [Actinomycetota bacterium]